MSQRTCHRCDPPSGAREDRLLEEVLAAIDPDKRLIDLNRVDEGGIAVCDAIASEIPGRYIHVFGVPFERSRLRAANASGVVDGGSHASFGNGADFGYAIAQGAKDSYSLCEIKFT